MRRVVVLGNPETKRCDYLRQAAAQTGLPVLFDSGQVSPRSMTALDGYKSACEEGKRLFKTAREEGEVLFVDWHKWRRDLIEGEVFLKIERECACRTVMSSKGT